MRSLSTSVSRWVPFVFLVVAIYIESGVPYLTFVPSGAEDLLVRKLGHAAVFGVLAVVVRWAIEPRRLHRDGSETAPTVHVPAGWIAAGRDWLIPLALTSLVAVGDELLQGYSPGRQAKLTDIAIDMTGAIASLVLLRSLRIRLAGRRRAGSQVARVADLHRRSRPAKPAEIEV